MGERSRKLKLERFEFTPAMGKKLRQLRHRAGLTLTDVAYMLGLTRSFASFLSLLERGKERFPSMWLVADYLRAVGASFSDLLPLLAEYTNRPPVRDAPVRERVQKALGSLRGRMVERLQVYDWKQADRLSPKGRVSAAKKQAEAAKHRRMLDNLMREEVNRLGVPPTMVVRTTACDYAWMVWSALELTKPKPRKKLGRPPKTRKQRLAEAQARIREMAPRVLPVRAYRHIEGVVVALYEDVHRFEKK